MCPKSIIQVIGRHPNTVYNNGRNNSFSKTLSCDQQHHIGAEQDPAPVDQGFYQGPCSGFHYIVSWFVINIFMNYLSIYNSIMQQARNRTLEYGFERHHVIPKSLGGANNLSNLVQLTLREHFVAHKLLTRIHTGTAQKKMWFAYYRLCNRHRHTTSRMYEQAKLQAKQYLSEIHTGKTISDAHKKAIREKCRGMVGYKHSATSKSLMTNAKIGNTHAKVGVNIIDIGTSLVVESLNSMSDLCKKFNLTRGQVEHYIYKQRPYNNLLFVRQKIIKRK
jgi:hypothetical protein